MSLKTLKPKVQAIDIGKVASPATQRIRGRKLQAINQRIGVRDGFSCRKCGRLDAHGEVDHIMPLHLGGRENDENRQWLCPPCHALKSAEEERGRTS
jgi:5-methylcytosine-specific restriction enzyme A